MHDLIAALDFIIDCDHARIAACAVPVAVCIILGREELDIILIGKVVDSIFIVPILVLRVRPKRKIIQNERIVYVVCTQIILCVQQIVV